MIPNVFINSTIRDLAYLREAVREEVGHLGYLRPLPDCLVAKIPTEGSSILTATASRASLVR
jgi:hypothetical protein